jgi:micrococcal nuclease
MSSRRTRSAGFRKPIVRVLVVIVLGLFGVWAKSQGWLDELPAVTTGSAPAVVTPHDVDADAETLVERVVDGDTLVIAGGDRIRLIGVDTPETKHPTKPPQPFGKEAYEFTRRTVEGKQVQIKFDPRETKDRYGRTLAYVYVDGQFLNEMLIRQGLARALLSYPFSAEMKSVFRNAEAAAKSERRGVWSLPQQPTDVSAKPTPRKAG